MQATNSDILDFFFDGRERGVRKIASESKEYGKFAALFKPEKLFTGSTTSHERGWLYAYFGGAEAQAFTAIAFDERQSRFFQELRVGGATYLFGEGSCKPKFGAKEASISDEEREVSWKYNGMEYEITVAVKRSKGTLFFKYVFSKLSDAIGNYRCIFHVLNQMAANWVIFPLKGSFSMWVDGDVSAFKLDPAVQALLGRNLESEFAYVEDVHLALPIVSAGWNWNVVYATRSEGEKLYKRFVGLMQFFVDVQGKRLPINFQYYFVDPDSGKFTIYGDASATLKYVDGLPVVTAKSPDGKLGITLKALSKPEKRIIKGVALFSPLKVTSADIDYAAFPNEATVEIDGEKFVGRGTSELAGLKKLAYWV